MCNRSRHLLHFSLPAAALFLLAGCSRAPKPADDAELSPQLEQQLRKIVREEMAASRPSAGEATQEADQTRAEIRKLVKARIQEELAKTDWAGEIQSQSVVKTLRRLERASRPDGNLDEVDLSAYATPREKLDRLLEELEGVTQFSGDCPLAGQFKALAPEAKTEFYAALQKLKSATGNTWVARQALLNALRPVLTAEDKDILLADLKTLDPELADIVRKLRLQEGGDYALSALATAKQEKKPVGEDIIEVAIDFHDEEALPLLLERLTTTSGNWGTGSWLAEVLDKQYPDADITAQLLTAARMNDGIEDNAKFSELLLKRGVPDGLDLAAKALANPESTAIAEANREKVRVSLRRYANVTGTDQEIAGWLRENRDKLRWNRELGMFEEGAATP